jgi:cathepsin X
LHSTDGFRNYKGGVYSEKTPHVQDIKDLELTHEVSIVGWGTTEDGQEYWIGRNSWGTYWGEHGFFRINMHSDNLGINNNCIWAMPVTEKDEITFYYLQLQASN